MFGKFQKLSAIAGVVAVLTLIGCGKGMQQQGTKEAGSAAPETNLQIPRQRRAATKKPKSLNEAMSNRMDEGLARLEADQMLKPPPGLTKAAGEVVDLGDLGFISGYLAETLDNPNMISVDASEQRKHLAAGVSVLQAAVDAAESAKAANSLGKMLCHQMGAAHCTAMKLIAYSFDHVYAPDERARLTNAAARMMQMYQEGFLTLQKIRTRGKQLFWYSMFRCRTAGRLSLRVA